MNTLKIVAGAWEDGWAFVLKDQQLFLLVPPYAKEDKSEVSEGTLEKAISQELLEQRYWEVSSKLLNMMLKSKPAQQSAELKEKISKVLAECK